MEPSTTYARKFELGLSFQLLKPNGMSSLVSYKMLRATVAEFLGMMLFLFNGITVVRFLENRDSMVTETSASIVLIAFTFGLSIFALVYVLADVSGAHLNPAVSIGLLVGKRITVELFVTYVIAQIAGSIAGAGIATTFFDSTGGGYNAVADDIDAVDAFGGEVLCTFLLVMTVFAATDGQLGRKNAFIGPLLPWAISMAVFLGHTIMIPIDGCSLNPARSLATAVTNNEWDNHWVFWIGPLLGGVLAAIVWETIVRPDQPIDYPVNQSALKEKHVVTAIATV